MECATILFVDDEERMLKAVTRSLIDEEYEIIIATSGKEALEILEKKEVHVLVTDVRMPEMSGLELLDIVKEKYPQIVSLVLSGDSDLTTLAEALSNGKIYKCIPKTGNFQEEFVPSIKEAVEYYNSRT